MEAFERILRLIVLSNTMANFTGLARNFRHMRAALLQHDSKATNSLDLKAVIFGNDQACIKSFPFPKSTVMQLSIYYHIIVAQCADDRVQSNWIKFFCGLLVIFLAIDVGLSLGQCSIAFEYLKDGDLKKRTSILSGGQANKSDCQLRNRRRKIVTEA